MTNLMIAGNTPTMSSREVAELTSKRHPDVKRDIEKMLSDLQEDVSNFAHIYLDVQNREQIEYLLDRDHTECLLTGYSAVHRMRVIRRWHELEQEKSLGFNPNDSIAVLENLLQEKKHVKALEAIIEQDQPKVQFVDSYVNATGSLGFRETCKLLHIKEPAFRKFLLDREIMYLLAGKLTPYAQHIDAGRFTIKTGENQANGHAFTQNKFTPKGIQWVAGLWAAQQIQECAA